jgi:hypothetical protein
MMHWVNELRRPMTPIPAAGSALAGLQAVMLGYLLYLGPAATMLLALLVGVPAAVACYRLLRGNGSRCSRMSAMMLAAGGFGMLAGCIADFGQVGLFGMLALCQASAASWFDPRQWWIVITLTPWTYTGMLIGGTLGMLWLDAAQSPRIPAVRRLALYGFCDLGMLVGMIVVERLVSMLTVDVAPTPGGLLMVSSMFVGMAAGMTAAYRLAMGLAGRRHALAISTG